MHVKQKPGNAMPVQAVDSKTVGKLAQVHGLALICKVSPQSAS